MDANKIINHGFFIFQVWGEVLFCAAKQKQV